MGLRMGMGLRLRLEMKSGFEWRQRGEQKRGRELAR